MPETAYEILAKIRDREITPSAHLENIFRVIEKRQKELNVFITLARKEASESAREEKDGKLRRLKGLVVAVKDNISTLGIRTTCGSMMLHDYVPPYNATVISLLRDEGAIVIGKTNMDEFGMGSSTEYSAFGPTLNPHDKSRVPGGSSGGSAAAVASGMADVALGSDTGGSIRCPASFCGVVGLKPTYGLVSRFGLVAYGNSLEQIGPIGRTVMDSALILNCIAKHDSKDSTSVIREPRDYTINLNSDLKGMRIGLPKELFGQGTQDSVSSAVWASIKELEAEGAKVEEANLAILNHALAAYYIIAMSEASSNLSRFDGLRYGLQKGKGARDWNRLFSLDRKAGFGLEVKKRIIMGTFALSAGYVNAYYLKAQKVRILLREEFERAFKRFDVMIAPTMPMLPFKIGEKALDPLAMYRSDIDTVPANLAGIPAISIPCGSRGRLPIGLQILAPPFREDLLFRVGSWVERFSKWQG